MSDLSIDFEADPFGDPLAGLFDLDMGVPAAASSLPVHVTELGDTMTACVIRVDGPNVTHQLYCVDDSTWSLVGVFGLFMDALHEIRQWRRYIAAGGTLAAFTAAHPDGISPERSAVAS